MKKNNNLFYDSRIVFKPWGYEYTVFRYKNILSVTLLNINKNKSTSLHCHPKKKNWICLVRWKSINSIGFMEIREKSV